MLSKEISQALGWLRLPCAREVTLHISNMKAQEELGFVQAESWKGHWPPFPSSERRLSSQGGVCRDYSGRNRGHISLAAGPKDLEPILSNKERTRSGAKGTWWLTVKEGPPPNPGELEK